MCKPVGLVNESKENFLLVLFSQCQCQARLSGEKERREERVEEGGQGERGMGTGQNLSWPWPSVSLILAPTHWVFILSCLHSSGCGDPILLCPGSWIQKLLCFTLSFPQLRPGKQEAGSPSFQHLELAGPVCSEACWKKTIRVSKLVNRVWRGYCCTCQGAEWAAQPWHTAGLPMGRSSCL